LLLLRAVSDVSLSRKLAAARDAAPQLPDRPALFAGALLAVWAGPGAAADETALDPAVAFMLGPIPGSFPDLLKELSRIDGAGWEALDAAFAAATASPAMADGGLDPRFPPALGRLAARLLSRWAAWLRGFEASSAPWLLAHAVRRPGRLLVDGDRLTVTLPPMSLDPALRRAGYLDAFSPPDWAPWRRIVFRIDHEASI
jgi:hypothetical protein